MDKKNSYKKSFISLVLFLLLVVSSFSNIVLSGFSNLSPDIDEEDGTWIIDTFEKGVDVNLVNCAITDNGKIALNFIENQPYHYDFSDLVDENKTNLNHIAYKYTLPSFFRFLSPTMYTNLGNVFTTDRTGSEYKNIAYMYDGKNDDDNESLVSPYSFLKPIQHFRIEVDKSEDITKLDVYWIGKAENHRKVSVYNWQSYGNYGIWSEIASSSNENIIEFNLPIDKDDIFISNEGYVDFCIVGTPRSGKKCGISTYYVKVTVYGKGYAEKGTATLIHPIDPGKISNSNFSWGRFAFNDYTEDKISSIKYHILYDNNTIISKTILPGNEKGFYSPMPLTSLNSHGIDKIKIQANLTTKDTSTTPKIYGWGLTWQTKENVWTDLFSSSLRVEKEDISNIEIKNESANIIPFLNDWPMFGGNPVNTRSSEGVALDSKPYERFWHNDKVGGNYLDPVVKEGILYIASKNGDKIFAFNATTRTDPKWKDNDEFAQGELPDGLVIKNSPAIGKYVIVATGNISAGGTENIVCAFKKGEDLSQGTVWSFKYGDNICYYASPVIQEISDDQTYVFVTSWSGDSLEMGTVDGFLNLTNGNNKIIVLNLEDGELIWEHSLPAGSFSSPAVYDNGKVIVGCANLKTNGISLLSLDFNKAKPEVWNSSVGPIGRASPIVYDNKVFVVVKEPEYPPFPYLSIRTKIKVVALRLDNGKEIWNETISDLMYHTYDLDLGASTPAIHKVGNEDLIFIASPNGTLLALDVDDGAVKWKKEIYKKTMLSLPLVSSPAYADERVYIGTPDGLIYCINALNGKIEWEYDKANYHHRAFSPIIVDGLLFLSFEDGTLMSFGSPKLEQQITDELISIPISLPDPPDPDSHSWVKFNVNFENSSGGDIDFSILDENKKVLKKNVKNDTIITDIEENTILLRATFTAKNKSSIASLKDWSVEFKEGPRSIGPEFNKSTFNVTNIPPIICSIQVKDNRTGLLNTSAEYWLNYTDQDGISNIERFKAQCTGVNNSISVETVSANISELLLNENISENVSDTDIRFNIVNIWGNESYSKWIKFDIVDITKPIFIENKFSSTDMPPIICNILVQDNRTGLLNTSAKYRLNYTLDGKVKETKWYPAQYTGANNSTSLETISANVSERNLSQDIIDTKISFSIENTAGNKSYSRWIEFNYTDKIEPVFFENTFSVTDEPPIICSIKVQDIRSGLSNISAEYSLNYTDGEDVKITDWFPAQCTGSNNSTSKETISANVSEQSLESNITHLQIQFSIKDMAGNKKISAWYPIGDHDYSEPVFDEDSFTPEWTNINTPICTIEVQDKDSDDIVSGLNVKSGKFNLKYEENNSINKETGWISADCSGSNGSKAKETISVDISKLNFSENITKLISIRFYIEDRAENGKNSNIHPFNTDTVKPSSEITNTADFKPSYNTTPVIINATAEDLHSGVKYVTLHYRTLPSGNWESFGSDDTSPYSWLFTAPSEEYELCTIATDHAGNEEEYPEEGDVSFIFDPKKPDVPLFNRNKVYKFDKLPEFSIVFKDDYKLKSVEYRLILNNEANEWTKINDEDIIEKSYEGNWNLTNDYWEYMIENEIYYMFFRLTDSLENQYITPNINESMMIEKNYSIQKYDPDLSDFEDWHWDNVFTVSVTANNEDITQLQLHYSYSADNKTWNEWKQHGDNQTESPFIWNFTAESGSGYYRFKTVVWDANGNVATSKVKSISVTLIPTIPVIIMIPLAVILILATAYVLGFKPFKIKKKKM